MSINIDLLAKTESSEGFEELLQDAKKEWQKKQDVVKKYQNKYDPDGIPHIKEANNNYYAWIKNHITVYGINITFNNINGEPIGLYVNLAGISI